MNRSFSILLTTGILLILGCSGSESNPIDVSEPQQRISNNSSHNLWGLWQFIADPEKGTLEIVPLRSPETHLNAVSFLEQPPTNLITLESPPLFSGGILDVDIGLRHPYPGMDQFTGFDVCGILITNGSISGFSNPGLTMAGPGDTRLLNLDGLIRWWNPTEFPNDGTTFSYKDGILGTPHEIADYNSTLNAYKFFCDDLTDPESPVSDVDVESRCFFSTGMKNIRHYTIELGGGLIFNYAVDASWRFPTGGSPWEVPDDFPPGANRPEAWNIIITESNNTLWNDGINSGGELSLEVTLWDHYDASLNILYLESPGHFNLFGPLKPAGSGEGWVNYDIHIPSVTPSEGSIDILIYAESEKVGYQNLLPGEHITSYFIYTAEVSNEAPSAPTAIMYPTTPTIIDVGGSVSFDATESTGAPPLDFAWDFNGDYIYDGPGDEYTGNSDTPTHDFMVPGTIIVTVKVNNLYGEDISEPVPVLVGYDLDDIYVDADFPGDFNDGSPGAPFITVQEGMEAVTPGHAVHVDYFDWPDGNHTYNTDGLVLKSEVRLVGDNWAGGGPGKPILKNNNGTYTIGSSDSLDNFILENFEIGVGETPDSESSFGIYFYGSSNNNIKVRHCHITGFVDDTGKYGGIGGPFNARNCDNSLFELNEIGPMTWYSETGGVYSRVLWGMYFNECDNTEVKNNFIHDITVDYSGGGGQIRLFLLHCYGCNNIDVHNNLICHNYGVNNYDYRIEAMMIESYSDGSDYHYYNNTIDNIDHSQSDGGFSLRGIIIYTDIATGSYINNTLVTNFYPGGGASIQAYYSSYVDLYEVTYSTGYNLGSITDYFHNFVEGPGTTNYPGIDPLYINNITQPYDYHFEEGSECEFGDPNFIDWDDSGTPSGDPDEPDIQNRSRMGCFGGPDGNWDPNDL